MTATVPGIDDPPTHKSLTAVRYESLCLYTKSADLQWGAVRGAGVHLVGREAVQREGRHLYEHKALIMHIHTAALFAALFTSIRGQHNYIGKIKAQYD